MGGLPDLNQVLPLSQFRNKIDLGDGVRERAVNGARRRGTSQPDHTVGQLVGFSGGQERPQRPHMV